MKWYFMLGVLVLFLAGCSEIEKFEYPDIKDDFCGPEINYQYCKCAFHDEYCDNIGMDKKAANKHVKAEFKKWVDELLTTWLTSCALGGGIPGDDDCTYCDEGFIAQEKECVPIEEADSQKKPDGPLNKDCTVDTGAFDKDWQKYSDIDDTIPFEDRSYEAKQALVAYDTMIDKMVKAFALERDIEIENQMQAELEEYKSALVQNIKS